MFIINSYWYKILQAPFEPTISFSAPPIEFFENVSFSTEFGSFKNAVINFYENVEVSASSPPEYQGYGTLQDPYLIYNGQQFRNMTNKPNAYYRVMNNINLDTWSEWQPINFYGYLDGQNYTIRNATITTLTSSVSHVGIFGYVSGSSATPVGTIKNVIFDNILLCNLTKTLSHKRDEYFYTLFPDLKGNTDNATSFF